MQAYSNVALVSSSWILLAYAQMPMGPTATMTERSAGQRKVSSNLSFTLHDSTANESYLNIIVTSFLSLYHSWCYNCVSSGEIASLWTWSSNLHCSLLHCGQWPHWFHLNVPAILGGLTWAFDAATLRFGYYLEEKQDHLFRLYSSVLLHSMASTATKH